MSSKRSHDGIRPLSRPDYLPNVMDDDAFYGLAGDIVNTIAPYTEASKEAMLLQLLACIGNVIGAGSHFVVEDDRHTGRLFVLIVGDTSLSGKGTSWRRVRKVMEVVDPYWTTKRILPALASGQGLIKFVQLKQKDGTASNEAVSKLPAKFDQALKKQGEEAANLLMEAAEQLVRDKEIHDSLNGRIMLVQEEFARTLKIMKRENDITSTVLREAFDSQTMTNPTVKPTYVDGVHFSAIAHITKEELTTLIDPLDLVNGLGNRFMMGMAVRRQVVPMGQPVPPEEIAPLTGQLSEVVKWAQTEQPIDFDAETEKLWKSGIYEDATESWPAVAGKLLDRARVHIRRLALLFSILDRSNVTTTEHLKAALAVWKYCEESTLYLFGDASPTRDKDLDKVIAVLQETKRGALKRSQISLSAFHNNKGRFATMTERLDTARDIGLELEVLQVVKRKGKSGAPYEVWKLKEDA